MIPQLHTRPLRSLLSAVHHFFNFRNLANLGLLVSVILSLSVNAKEHNIEEIDITIDIPNGFVSAQNFAGFVHPQTFTTIRYEESLVSFAEAKTSLLQSLPDIEEQQPIEISNRSGILIRHSNVIDDNQFELWTLVFGDRISSIAVSASYPKTMGAKIADKMLAALKSTRWLRLASEQLFTGLPFVADQSKDLVITQRNKNAIVMSNKNPVDPKKSLNPIIALSVGAAEKPLDAIATFSRQLLKMNRIKDDIEVLNQQAVSISGIQGFEIIATATDKITGKPLKIMQTVLYQKHRYLLAQAMVEVIEAERYWPQFKAITNSVKFK